MFGIDQFFVHTATKLTQVFSAPANLTGTSSAGVLCCIHKKWPLCKDFTQPKDFKCELGQFLKKNLGL